jgi:sugar O-acyltransferase (sialic acid O-acetyltransferase NeuD family)
MRREQGLHIIGAGGHSKVVISTLVAAGIVPASVHDDDKSKSGGSVMGILICGGLSFFDGLSGLQAIIAIGDNRMRRKIALQCSRLDWSRAIHPTAYIHPSAKIGKGTVVFAGALIQPDAVIGDHCIINTGAVIDHDCIVDDFVHVAPGVRLAGGVHVGEGSLVGIGASVIPGIRIGEWGIVGAGAAVVVDVEPRVHVAGVPARPI